MTTQLIQLGKLSLAMQSIPQQAATEPAPVHHVIAIDISGSMHFDLPELRKHLKNKLASLVGPNDTVSILWFSGRGQFGTLVEAMKVNSLGDLTQLHTAIDRFLQPMGLTGFTEPLTEVKTLVGNLRKKSPNYLVNFFFLTDGYDNQGTTAGILAVCKDLEPLLDSAAIVEYGWNCNRPLLTKMAETVGGKLVFSENFPSYVAALEGALQGSTKKVRITLTHKPSKDYVFAVVGRDLLTYTPDEAGDVLVPEGLTAIGYFTDKTGTPFDPSKKNASPLIWAALAPLAQRMDTECVFSMLGALGDVRLVESFSNCFSKEDYSRFEADVLSAAADAGQRYLAGYDANAVPKEDAYTVLDLLGELSSSDENLFYPYHESFEYSRTGAATEARSDAVKFSPDNKGRGYPIDDLVWNADRPNVNIRVCIDGTVRLPDDRPAVLPATLPSRIYRNYTIIRDGIVHTRKLPMSLSANTFNALQANGLLQGEQYVPGKVYVLEYPKLPVINRKMVKSVSAAETFQTVLDLSYLKGAQKVLNDYRSRVAPKVSASYLLLYGEDATNWLKDRGVTEYNGFNPPSNTVKSGDFYIAKELTINIKGISSLPKVVDVAASLAAKKTDPKKKLKIGEVMMAPAIEGVEAFVQSPAYAKNANAAGALANWIESESRAVTAKTRELNKKLAQLKFAIMVGHVWFSDMASIDDNSRDIDVPGYGPVKVTATLSEVEIAV